MQLKRLLATLAMLPLLAACGSSPVASTPAEPPGTAGAAAASPVLRLATTTSTADSGLLDAILPAFEALSGAKVEVIATGTGQALELGANGDVDVVLVHAREREEAFIAAGDGINRYHVMYNDFVIVGPVDDPAGIKDNPRASAAFAAIAAARATFVSRGDESGTHAKEQSIWASIGMTPTGTLVWYRSLGQGMGETLITANELGAYTLTDRATWLSTRKNVPNLTLLVGGATIEDNPDRTLYNPYSVIVVNPAKHPTVNHELAVPFANWLTSPETRAVIRDFGRTEYGQSLFLPEVAP
ncbi:MAG: substrate-binding domain-containing protein [Chloroflexi bacterium]|nr:substrate-binding domain-containing protein [Chloroflexota bacterium]